MLVLMVEGLRPLLCIADDAERLLGLIVFYGITAGCDIAVIRVWFRA